MEYAKRLNRTMILGPWIEYNAKRETGKYPYFPAFEEIFSISKVSQYHRAIDAYQFMNLFGERWKSVGMIGFAVYEGPDRFIGKQAGVPRDPFWRNLGVNFTGFQTIGTYENPQVDHAVLALDCIPGRYPAPRSLDPLAGYFEWSDNIQSKAQALIKDSLGGGTWPFIAVHWRSEFAHMTERGRPCGGFSAVQCGHLIANNAVGIPDSMCAPSVESMRAMIKAAMEITGARHLFLAADAPIAHLGKVGSMFAELNAITQEGGTGKRTTQRISFASLMIQYLV